MENTELNELLTIVVQKRGDILSLEQEIKQRKKELNKIEDILISMMLNEGMTSFKNNKNISVSVGEKTNYSILKENRELFHDWLRNNGYGSLIKNSVNTQTMQAFFRNDYEGKLPDVVKEYKRNILTIRGIGR